MTSPVGRRAARPATAALPLPSAELRLHSTSSTQRSATGLPIAGGRSVRRPLGSHVGDLLIRAGTRLGGGNLRTS
ncbi:MAG TPA: hypothetical protein VHV57_02315 [Acidimicrobiales bacterium]|nr:hypothetical protein [Acidimicrobiales bacterium]